MSFGGLELRLINLLRTGAPDFVAAEELIAQGANINAESGDEEENVLSEILRGYWWSEHDDSIDEDTNPVCEDCEKEDCKGCEYNTWVSLNPNLGESMCKIIQFFLDHGFDVNKSEGRFGAQCLDALTLSTFDRYMIDATKLLFNAGAQNIPTRPEGDASDTPLSSIGTEASFQGTCEHNHSLANIFEATCQVYEAVENNRPYQNIDSYEKAIGKKILKVLATPTKDDAVFFSIDLQTYQKDNCFTSNLYFVYDDGMLITTKHADFWVDTILPDANILDVSQYFPGVTNSTIISFTFSHRNIAKGSANYGQPITFIEMDSGVQLKVSINFGEVKDEYRAAYFELS